MMMSHDHIGCVPMMSHDHMWVCPMMVSHDHMWVCPYDNYICTGLDFEGLYRVSGKSNDLLKIKKIFDSGK